MEKRNMPGVALFALLLLFTGTLTLHENLLGKTLSGALLAGSSRDDATTPVDSLARVHADSLRVVSGLMKQIRENPSRLNPLPPDRIDSETLWLARCIYSETKRPEEMELVAWVVRNRVETAYRGQQSYRDAVLDPFQFSAFNPQSRSRQVYSNLTPESRSRNWQKALAIAYGVRGAPDSLRPFSLKTRHFYSEQSMIGRNHPDWARGMKPVEPERAFSLDQRRFRFYEGVF